MKQLAYKLRTPGIVALSIMLGAALSTGLLVNAPVTGAERTGHTWDTVATTVDSASPSVAAIQAISDGFAEIVDHVAPGVVFIEVEKEMKGIPAGSFGQGSPIPEEFFRRFFGPGAVPEMPRPEQAPRGPVPMGQGSGFIISRDGYVVTNHHVAADADLLRVTLADGRQYLAELVGTDPGTEIALIKIDGDNLPVVPLGDSDQLRVGEWVLAIGSPFNLKYTVTSGIVSARGRGVRIVDYADFIQTDAAINPGNSGGPLLNTRGEVIGVNTAIMSRSGGSNGIGFAIPINMVKYVVDEIRTHGTVSRGFMGVSIQQLTPELADWFDIAKGHGVLVSEVHAGSPADKAGIKRDDIIVEFNGQPVTDLGAFRSRVSITPSGSKAPITVLRNGKRLDLTVQLGTLPVPEEIAKASLPAEQEVRKETGSFGLTVQELTRDMAARLGYEQRRGVVVAEVKPGSPAARQGLKPGNLIREVNKREVRNLRDYERAIKAGDKDTVLMLVQEADGTRYVALNIT
jgi:serine protease Do